MNLITELNDSHLAPPGVVLSGDVDNDQAALRIFLSGYAMRSPHTLRAYEKECSRYLLWLNTTRYPTDAALPLASVEDANQYIQFMASPRAFNRETLEAAGWDHQPFRKPLGPESMKHAVIILHKLYEGLRNLRAAGNQPYCMFNPFAMAHQGVIGVSQDDEMDEVEQALTQEEWNAVQQVIEVLPRESPRDLKHYHRARWIFQLLFRCFLRRHEAASITMGDFQHRADGWGLRVKGKGGKTKRIIATRKLMDELKVYRTSLGLAPLPSPGESRPAIMAITGKEKGITDQAIYLVCNVIFAKAAALLKEQSPEAAKRLEQASPHWMRHTGITHALEGGAERRYVQAQARHANSKTTDRYDHKQRHRWREDLENAQE